MKVQVAPNLWYGDVELCDRTREVSVDKVGEMLYGSECLPAILHALKDPDHRQAVGYKGRAPDRNDPRYYFARQGPLDLVLNLIDPEVPLFAFEVFDAGLAFIDEHVKDREVFVHCNLGLSRAPSLALLHLARTGMLPNRSYQEARDAFASRWVYAPGKGIAIWLAQSWARLVR